MDTRTPHDHARGALARMTASGASPEPAPEVDDATSTAPEDGADASDGFQVLSLEQYAASHARSLHEPHDR